MNPVGKKPLGIFFLDAGRKYFGPPAIRKLLDAVSQAGLELMQLYVSDNQGFRFAPDDRALRPPCGVYNLPPPSMCLATQLLPVIASFGEAVRDIF